MYTALDLMYTVLDLMYTALDLTYSALDLMYTALDQSNIDGNLRYIVRDLTHTDPNLVTGPV